MRGVADGRDDQRVAVRVRIVRQQVRHAERGDIVFVKCELVVAGDRDRVLLAGEEQVILATAAGFASVNHASADVRILVRS